MLGSLAVGPEARGRRGNLISLECMHTGKSLQYKVIEDHVHGTVAAQKHFITHTQVYDNRRRTSPQANASSNDIRESLHTNTPSFSAQRQPAPRHKVQERSKMTTLHLSRNRSPITQSRLPPSRWARVA
jgi:hypothetical protein